MNSGTWSLGEQKEVLRIPIEELHSDDLTKLYLKIGQRFAHPLYEYRMQIIKLKYIKMNP